MPVQELADRLDVSTRGGGGASRSGGPGRGRQPRALPRRARCSRPASTRTPTGSSSAASTWARRSRRRSSAAPGTSAPARPSPSRCRARCCRAACSSSGAKLRGEVSEGMILSERELELGTDHSGIMVLEDGEPGTPLADVLPLARRRSSTSRSRATGRTSCPSTASRGRSRPCIGSSSRRRPAASRERTATSRSTSRSRTSRAARATSGGSSATCSIGPSPAWLRARLTAAGHAADLERRRRDELRDARRSATRCTPSTSTRSPGAGSSCGAPGRARSCARSTASSATLEPADLMIADAERSVALAGIMGGEETEIGEGTTNVLLEAANFEPTALWRTLGAPAPAHRGLEPLGEGRRPVPRRAGRDLGDRADRRARRRALGRAHGREARAPGAAGRPPSGPSGPSAFDRPRRTRRRSSTSPRAPRLRAARTARTYGADLACPRRRPARSTWSRRSRGSSSTTSRSRCRVRREMAGRLTREQRAAPARRRTRSSRCGFSEVYTPSLARAGPRSRRADAAGADHRRAGGPADELLPSRSSRRPGGTSMSGNERIALFEIARVYLPRGEASCRTSGWHVAGDRRGRLRTREGRGRGAAPRAHAPATLGAGGASALRTRARRRATETGVVGELHPAVLEGTWGGFELDLDALAAASSEPVAVRGRDHLPGGQAGSRVRRRRGRDSGGARGGRARGGRAGAARDARLRRLSRRADRRRAGSPLPSGSSSSRRSGRSPTRTRPRCGERIVAALAERFGAELRA